MATWEHYGRRLKQTQRCKKLCFWEWSIVSMNCTGKEFFIATLNRKIFCVQILSNTAQALTSVILAYRGHGTMSLAWGPVANVATQTALLTLFRPRDTLMLPNFRAARQVFLYGSMFVGSRVIEVFARNAHEFFIAKQFGFSEVGFFSRAFGLIDLFYTNVASAKLPRPL